MQIDADVAAALQPFARRGRVVAFLKYAMLAAPMAIIGAQILWLAGIRRLLLLAFFIALWLGISVVIAFRQRRSMLDVARHVDARARLQDLVVSAVGSRDDGLASLVRRDAIAALKPQSPAAIYPVELPAHWRQFAAAALVVEAVMLAIVWQAPAERAATSSLTALVLPSTSNGSAAPSPPLPDRTPDAARAATESTPSPSGATATPQGGPGVPAIEDPASAAASAAAAANERLRLAAASAETDLSAGRVPAARRAIVERYFAALQSQRKTPR